jgi:siroheme synthase
MWQTASSLELELPEFPYGSVWLVRAGDGDPRQLSPIEVRALGTADAVIHDLAVPRELLDLVKPSHYCEAGSPYCAIGSRPGTTESSFSWATCLLPAARRSLLPFDDAPGGRNARHSSQLLDALIRCDPNGDRI